MIASLGKELEGILRSTEGVIMILKQSHWSTLTPGYLIVTDENIITVHFSFWHYYTGIKLWKLTGTTRKNIIPYKNVVSATLMEGNFLSTLEIKTKDIEFLRGEGARDTLILEGIYAKHADKMAKVMGSVIVAHQFPPPVKEPEALSLEKAVELCNTQGKNIVWTGFEEIEEVASALSIAKEKLAHITLSQFLNLPDTELRKYHDSIILGYTGNSESVIAKVLLLELQLNCYIIEGGMINNIKHGKEFVRKHAHTVHTLRN